MVNGVESNEEIQSKDVSGEESKVSLYDGKVKALFSLSTLFIIVGFYKRFVYSYSEYSYSTDVNAYVGGDAYNYIINSNHMIAYFILALICVIIGCTFIIVNAISGLKITRQ